MKVSVIQMEIQEDKGANLKRAQQLIAKVSDSQLIVLPEMFNCPYDINLFAQYAEEYPTGETIQFLAETAYKQGVFLVGGSIPEREGFNIYNTGFVFDPAGKLLARHRKMHLFDVNIAGGPTIQESKTLTPGDQATSFAAKDWQVGLAICYDIRFPELMRALTLKGAELIVLPAVFNVTTGQAHWQELLRIRAVDNQVYMIGAAPARNTEASYVAWGHSMIVDPWGEILAQAGSGEEIISAEISHDRINQIRREFPLLQHRKGKQYS